MIYMDNDSRLIDHEVIYALLISDTIFTYFNEIVYIN